MNDENRTNAELLKEIRQLRKQIRNLKSQKPDQKDALSNTSNQKYKLLLEAAKDAIFVVKLDGRISECNNSAFKMYGYKKAEMLNLTITDIISKELFNKLLSSLDKLENKNGIFTETKNGKKDGTEFPVEINFHLIVLNNKKFILVCVHDISERKKVEKKLRDSEERFRSIFENTSIGLYRTTPNGKILLANPALIQMFGYTTFEDLKQRNLNQKGFKQKFPRKAYKELIEKDGKVVNLESAWKKEDGSTLYIRENATVVHDMNGKILYYEGTAEDITEHKQAEEALRLSEEKYRSLIENSNDAIYLLYDGKFEVINKRFEEMFGVTPDEVKSPDFNFMQLVADKSKKFVKDRAQLVAKGQEPGNRYEFTALTRYNKEIEVEVSVSYISYRGGRATQGILRDITQRKELEIQLRQAQKMEAIGTLAGGIAHDFNNILTGISGYTQLALSKLSPQHPLFDDLKKVEHAASHAETLTRQILAFSRKQELEMRSINLNKIVLDLTRFLKRIIGEHIDVSTVLEDNLPTIYGDPSAIEQVLTNLCASARNIFAIQ